MTYLETSPRYRSGRAGEYRLQARFALAGWETRYFSLIQHAPESFQDAARSTPLAYIPDLIAWRGGVIILVDAKATVPRTHCCIETAEAQYQAALAQHLNRPLYYVFGGGETITAGDFSTYAAPGVRGPGNGSGTPFLACPVDRTTPFADVFE